MDVYEATDCMLVAQLDRVGLVRQLEMLVLLRCRKRYFVRASVQHFEKSRTFADSKPDLPKCNLHLRLAACSYRLAHCDKKSSARGNVKVPAGQDLWTVKRSGS